MNQQSMLPDTETLQKRKGRRAESTLAEFIDECRAAGKMAIPADDPIYAYAERAGIPDDFLQIAWLEFRERHVENPAKTYRDWRAAFRNAVRDNWYRLWRYADGQCVLTISGEQAARVHGKAVPQRSSKFDPVAYVNRNRKPTRWNNFDQIDYREGVNEDGSF